jgi:hypothetical protein
MTVPPQGITVITTSGTSTYQVPSGASFNREVTVTGELMADVFAAPAGNADPEWLASFGNVEAVFQAGMVVPVEDSEPEPSASVKSASPWG